MSSHHAHHHDHVHYSHSPTQNLQTAFWLNFIFCLIELAGGHLTRSVAITSDALHDFGDSLSLLLAWYFQKISRQKSNAHYSYGYKRFALMGALISSLVLLIGSVFIIITSLQHLANPQAVSAQGMLWLALLGIGINGLAYWRLRSGSSLAEKSVGLHILEDALGWLAVLVASVLMLIWNLPWLDPLLSLAITLYILYHVYLNLREIWRVLFQGTPLAINQAAIVKVFKRYPQILSFHDLHWWSLDGQYNILSAHLVLNEKNLHDPTKLQGLKNKIKTDLNAINIHHATLETESPKDQSCPQHSCN